MPVISLNEIPTYCGNIRNRGESIVCVSGVFDLLHVGHTRFLSAASELADRLIVSLDSDDAAKLRKGRTRPILSCGLRAEIIESLKVVDAVVTGGTHDEHGNSGLDVIELILPDFTALSNTVNYEPINYERLRRASREIVFLEPMWESSVSSLVEHIVRQELQFRTSRNLLDLDT